MSDLKIIAVDAMGGDNAPAEVVKGAVEAVNEKSNIKVMLCGTEEPVAAELAKYAGTYDASRIELIPTTEVIEMAESPVTAIRSKKDSSLVRALSLVKEGTAAAVVTAGSTGATLVGGQLIAGRIKGIDGAALAPLIPTATGVSLLIDCGAKVDARPSNLVQYAKMGSIYMQQVMGIESPRVAIVNIGAEEEKGNALVKETFPLLKACEDINFIGNIEARDIPAGDADVIVCEAFVGNVILKLYEGLGATLISLIKSGLTSTPVSTLGAALAKPALKKTLKAFDTAEYGGAPLLGLNGLVVKTHGSSKSVEIKNSIIQCLTFAEQDVNSKIKEKLGR